MSSEQQVMKNMSSEQQYESSFPIQLTGINQRYHIGTHTVDALNDIGLRIHDGEFVMVMGPSGSGKSTLLNIIAGLEPPSAGEVMIMGQFLHDLSDRQLCEIRRHQIGIVFQFFNLHPTLTAQENVELPMLISGKRGEERVQRAKELLEMVGLGKRLNHYPHELSGGEKQRVGIARALANDPTIILADEPTGDMDSVMGKEIMELIHTLNKQYRKTVVCVTHDEEMIKPGMRLIKMEDGRIKSDTNITSED